MKYAIPFMMVILAMSFFACKKEKDKETTPPTQRLASSFTGMKTWRHVTTYMLHTPDRDTTYAAGSVNFEVKEVNRDTIYIGSDRLWFKSSEGDSSSRFVLNYSGFGSRNGVGLLNMNVSFVHTPAADTIYYFTSFTEFGYNDRDSYATP